MKLKIESSATIKPIYDQVIPPPNYSSTIPLSVFDKVTYDTHIAVIYAYRPPTPSNDKIKLGLEKALAEYREWAGRLAKNDDNGETTTILLNDAGVKFVEASVDSRLDQVMPLKPSPELLKLHPCLKGVEELVQVQVTRFNCGSMVIGFTAHHLVADGHATSNFLVAWGQATRGVQISPLPSHDRTIFAPRDPPKFEYDHKGVELMPRLDSHDHRRLMKSDHDVASTPDQEIVVHKVHFTKEFLAKLKAKASNSSISNMQAVHVIDHGRPFSTFESLLAHLWRTITKARGLGGMETTSIRISVNGRMRLNNHYPPAPNSLSLNSYFGNLVLWGFPTAKVKDLIREPLSYAAKLIHDAVTRVNKDYFLSFIDYATYKMPEEDLIPTACMNKTALCPNLEVDSWLRFPFYDLDFGGGCPYVFMPSYFPTEGMMFLLPSFIGDGSIEAFIPLFREDIPKFKEICYTL